MLRSLYSIAKGPLVARYSTRIKGDHPVLSSFTNDRSKRAIELRWNDGKVGYFPYVWLRDTSPDPETYTFSEAMTARNLTMRDFDVDVQPDAVNVDNDHLVVQWPTGLLSKYSSEWLRVRNPSDESMREHRREVYLEDAPTWNAEQIQSRLCTFKFNQVINDDLTLHDFLTSVCHDGIAVVSGGTADAVAQIGRRIGLIHRTHFGEIFEVSTKPDASNMAYASNKELPFHTDFPSLSDPPQLQMLHMLERAEKGGLNLFVDGFHVAEQMRKNHRKEFDLLSRVRIEYIEQGYDVHEGADGKPNTYHYDMTARHRVIRTDADGRVIRIQFGNAMRSWFYECDATEIEDVYRAMKLFTEYCYRPDNVFRIQLENEPSIVWLRHSVQIVVEATKNWLHLGPIYRRLNNDLYCKFHSTGTLHYDPLFRMLNTDTNDIPYPGDVVLWANTRLLHTRDAFEVSPGKARRLAGCYFSWDMLKSRVRQLRDKLNHHLNQPCA